MITIKEPIEKQRINLNTLNEIIYYIKEEFKLKHPCLIYMGGSLVYYGLRDYTNDLDCGVSTDDFENMLNILKESGYDTEIYKKSLGNRGFKLYYKNHEIEIFDSNFMNDKNYDMAKEYCIENHETVYFQSLIQILEIKKRLNRDKDRNDIRMIEEFLRD